MTKWMLYGANGYTGRLIAEAAARRGLEPILAGRNRDAIEELAAKHSMEFRVFDLADMGSNLQDVSAVLLAAGPFVHTSEQVVQACLLAGIHYLDITGEIDVYEALHRHDERAKAAGSVILPGVGFDVVPTDCLAATLAKALPDATELELAFAGGRPSKGTAKTMLAHIGDGGAIREDGQIKKVPLGFHAKSIAFHDKPRYCVTIPWGDVSTAYYSTGIGNIRVYTSASPGRVRQMKMMRYVAPILSLGAMQRLLGKLIEARVAGPDDAERDAGRTQLWGQVRNRSGETVSATLTATEGYTLTAECSVEAAERVASVAPGFQTPSRAFGPSFITEFEGCSLRVDA